MVSITTVIDDELNDHDLDWVLDFETSKHAMLEHDLRPPGNAEGFGLSPTDQLFRVWNQTNPETDNLAL